MAIPDGSSRPSTIFIFEQPCFPSLRQQAGSVEPECTNRDAGISGMLKNASSKMADALRKPRLYNFYKTITPSAGSALNLCC